jgi:hypothetical protein
VRAAPLARRGCRRRRARVAQRRSYAPWSRTRRRRARRVRAPWCVRRARGGGTLNLMKCAKKAPVSSDKTSTETKNTAHHASSHMVLGNFTLRANSLKNIECEEQRKTRCEIRACSSSSSSLSARALSTAASHTGCAARTLEARLVAFSSLTRAVDQRLAAGRERLRARARHRELGT